MPRGIRTSEFWATVALNVATLISSLTETLPAKWAAGIGVISTGLYAVARGLAKNQSK